MKYTIMEYRAVEATAGLWRIEVKIEWTKKAFGIFPVRKDKWISCGKDGEPRVLVSLLDAVSRKNRLLLCDSKQEAEHQIKIFNATKKGTII